MVLQSQLNGLLTSNLCLKLWFQCQEECPLGTYGVNCTEHCSCSNGATCSHISGRCFCKDGWLGKQCSKPACPPNQYGPGCSQICSCEKDNTERWVVCNVYIIIVNTTTIVSWRCENSWGERFFNEMGHGTIVHMTRYICLVSEPYDYYNGIESVAHFRVFQSQQYVGKLFYFSELNKNQL